jgi:hypothetical protein
VAGYDTAALIARFKLKAFTSSSSSLSDQEILDLLDDSFRSYLVPMSKTLREEWWVGPSDLVLLTDANGAVTVPDTVASTLRTVSWDNAGVLRPLSRIEPERSFNYLRINGNIPLGFELRGYTLVLLPKVPNISVHITAMLRPPQMVLTSEAGEVVSRAGAALTLDAVPLAWQSSAPTQVDVVSSVSPFSVVGTFGVVSLAGSVLTLDADPGSDAIWVADVGYSPFPNVPIELHPLLEQDAIVQLFSGLGDKRLLDAAKRRDELEKAAKATMGPRTQGHARPIVNYAAPGMRGGYGWGPWR